MQVQDNAFRTKAEACRLIYQTWGLPSALFALKDICDSVSLEVDRINALYIPADMSLIINIGDTHLVWPSNCRRPGHEPPVLLAERLREPVRIDDLEKYKTDRWVNDPDLADLPFLKYHSLVRLPLCSAPEHVCVLNFWASSSRAFGKEDVEFLKKLTEPLSEVLSLNHMPITMDHGAPVQVRTSQEKLEQCAGLAQTLRQVEEVAPTKSTVLIIGETGSGKEAVADSIHELSPRKNGPLIKINCGAIPESLLDSELFGYEKGAFTGAGGNRKGYFEAAHGGTLVLDEIAEMSLFAQVHLLRVLESGMVNKVGNPIPVPVDVRLVAATHADLRERVAKGLFRKDLWYRLSVFPITVPPLRHRKGDIPQLVRHFLSVKAEKLNLRMPINLSEKDLVPLFRHDWPGNVRELEHVVERALIRSKRLNGKLVFDIDTLPTAMDATEPDRDWPTLKTLEERYVRSVLDKCGGKLTGPGGATELLGIHYTTLRNYMRKLSMPMPREKEEGEG